MEKPEDIICPICGYYCIGSGRWGCIDKVGFYEKLKDLQKDLSPETQKIVDDNFWDLV